MNLEQLQQHWQRLEHKLDQSLALQTELVRQASLQPARRQVNRMAVWPIIDIVFFAAVLVGLAAWFSGWPGWYRAAPAWVVLVSVVVLLADNIRQLTLVSQIDWAGPVAAIQGSLETIRAARIRQFKWVILFSPLAGFCGLMTGAHWLYDFTNGQTDFFAKVPPSWIAGNYLFGVLFAVLGHFAAGWLARRCGHQRWWKSFLDDLAGSSLKQAGANVKRWAELQR